MQKTKDILNGIRNIYPLFAVPTFILGFASAFDLFGNLDTYNYSHTPKDADSKAFASDWKAIGFDIKIAVDKYASEHHVG